MTVNIRQAQLDLVELLDCSSRGEEVIIVRDDGGMAGRLVWASTLADDFRPGFLKDKLEIVTDDDQHLDAFAEYI